MVLSNPNNPGLSGSVCLMIVVEQGWKHEQPFDRFSIEVLLNSVYRCSTLKTGS
jgi:hypothetical protein